MMSDRDRMQAGPRGSLPSDPRLEAPPGSGQISVHVSPEADARARTQAGSSPGVIAPGVPHKLCPTCGARHPEHFRVCPQDGAALVDADELVGTTLARTYAVTRILGEGGMGRVYEAQHARIPSKRFAIKALHPELAEHQTLVARFHREAAAAAAIRSHYVVEVYDVTQTADGRPVIVSELLEGKDLSDHLIEVGRIPVAAAVRIARQVCKGLGAAHAQGIVHRDMKPENVFLAGDRSRPTAKVLDFGISRVDDKQQLTQTGMVMGTPSYMAPEQARGERVDHRADLYAVGAVLYRALTGQPPFDRGDNAATLLALLSEEPPRPRSLNPEISIELELVLQRAMAKSPDERYPTAAALDAALAPFDPSGDEPEPEIALRPAPGEAPSRVSVVLSAREAAEVNRARPMILLSAACGLAGLACGLIAAIAGVARLAADDGAGLSGTGSTLLTLGVGVVVLGPAIAAALHVRRAVWGDGQRVLQLWRRIAGPIAIGLGAYGYASLLVRLLETYVLLEAARVAWPFWDVLLFVIGAGGAGGAIIARRMRG
jgi:serine/threonine-protein kinase